MLLIGKHLSNLCVLACLQQQQNENSLFIYSVCKGIERQKKNPCVVEKFQVSVMV